jgi:hypothetical protein
MLSGLGLGVSYIHSKGKRIANISSTSSLPHPWQPPGTGHAGWPSALLQRRLENFAQTNYPP